MLLTRIPVPRLVDWTDQAILHLHVDEGDRATLRRYGIRTASDLVHACASAPDKDEFSKILDSEAGKPKRLEVIVEAMKDEPWMDNIRFWHGDIGEVEGRQAWPEQRIGSPPRPRQRRSAANSEAS
jgi:hypothetical protein